MSRFIRVNDREVVQPSQITYISILDWDVYEGSRRGEDKKIIGHKWQVIIGLVDGCCVYSDSFDTEQECMRWHNSFLLMDL